jgi:hypothetical protein
MGIEPKEDSMQNEMNHELHALKRKYVQQKNN